MADKKYRFRLVLTTEQVLAFYQGHVTAVVVQADNGLRVQLDLRHFRRYFQHSGVDGHFELLTEPNGKFKALHKIN
jgi:hypothetical protein